MTDLTRDDVRIVTVVEDMPDWYRAVVHRDTGELLAYITKDEYRRNVAWDILQIRGSQRDLPESYSLEGAVQTVIRIINKEGGYSS